MSGRVSGGGAAPTLIDQPAGAAARSGRARSALPPIWALSGLSPATITSRIIFFGLVLMFALVSATCLLIASRWIDRPFAGFLMNERMVPGNVGRYDWTGTQAGLKYPDKVLTANGWPVSSMDDLTAIIRETEPGDPVKYAIERDGRVVEVTVPTMRFTWADLVMTFGITFLSGLLFLFLGVVVFLLKHDARVSWVFLVMSACLGLYSVTAFDIQSTHAGFIRLYLLVLTLLPAALVHLSLLFPERLSVLDRYPFLHTAPYLASASLIIPMQALYP